MATQRLLYLHGFRSSPQSSKARRLAAWLAARRPQLTWCCPQLPPSPAQAMALVRQLTADWPVEGSAVVGSSLGGFYATVLAEATGWPAVVLNPAVDPARDLASHVGERTDYHAPHRRFHFHPQYLDELRAMTPVVLTDPQRYLAVIAKGDELLSWQEMAARYAGAQQLLLEGSDHGLSDFEQQLPAVLRFLRLD